MPTPATYSRLQIRLHWLTAALVLAQYVFPDAIAAAWRASRREAEIAFDPAVPAHVLAGLAILGIALWRLALRWRHGAPAAQGGALIARLSQLGHMALYALLVLMAASGAAAWFGGIAPAAGAHGVLKLGLLALILGHAGAALWHQFLRRDGTLSRMM